ncbi:LytTR family DNA-binding domain-containing protein [uncultured Metabacillus sp.]|uniref:LytR/AlgR family response regulator transcription factor n=1 Tax=Metabacillus sp. Hm71 TaxID=3450743 RepID=UPI002618C198|nr:LytTR family DNA-binding domain-containing protein [uncultured Metabacillus sp.]
MKIKVMIAEDERLTREDLAFLIQQEEEFILCPSAENGQQLIELYEQYKPDLVILDINMPSLSGIEAAKQLRKLSNGKSKPYLIFTTAYDEYAVEAFNLEAVDYLLKPYDVERFREALSRVQKQMVQPERKNSNSSKLLIDNGEKVVVLTPQSIYYAVRSERLVDIHTDKGLIQTKMTLQELEEKLPPAFFRSHRSYLVNLDYIDEIVPWFNGAYNIILKNIDQTKIPVSRSAAKQLFDLLQD